MPLPPQVCELLNELKAELGEDGQPVAESLGKLSAKYEEKPKKAHFSVPSMSSPTRPAMIMMKSIKMKY